MTEIPREMLELLANAAAEFRTIWSENLRDAPDEPTASERAALDDIDAALSAAHLALWGEP